MKPTNSQKKRLSVQTKKPTKGKKSTQRRVVSDTICRTDLEYATLDSAIKGLLELKETYGKTHRNLHLENIQDRDSDSYTIWLTGYREETDREILDREEQEAQKLRYERAAYEKLKAKFEK